MPNKKKKAEPALSQKRREPSREDEILKSLDEFDKQITAETGEGAAAAAVVVLVSKDMLKASVKVTPGAGPLPDKASVLKALADAGVTHGINEKEIEDLLRYGSFGCFVPVAFGEAPVNGKNAYVDYRFNISKVWSANYEADAKGNIDHHALNLVESVQKGDTIAVKVPPTPGTPGKDVFSRPVPATDGRAIQMAIGDNARIEEGGQSVAASISGSQFLRDGKLYISAVYEVAGNVDFLIGNIDFDGSVLVHGDVLNDFTVRAADDIQIKGNVEKATIIAGGNITVNGGMYGLNTGYISAGDSVVIRSVESGTVEAERNITILQAARHSTLIAGEEIHLSNSKGSIMGGRIICGKLVDVTELGSPSFTETSVEIGLGPRTSKIYHQQRKELAELKDKRDKIALNVRTLQHRKEDGSITPDKDDLLSKLLPAFHQLNAQIEDLTLRFNFLVEKINALAHGRCRVNTIAHPGVKIITPNATYTVKNESAHCCFYEFKNEIIMGPY